MSYSAGLGQGRGWNLFYFILTPDEFSTLFDGLTYSIIGTGRRGDKNCEEMPKQDFFDAYRTYFEELLIGQQSLNTAQFWDLERPIRQKIIDRIDKIVFEDSVDEKGNPTPCKLVVPLEPVINIDPFYLFWSPEEERLSLVYLNEPGIIGLRLSYPKFVSFNGGKYEETTTYETAKLYELLIKRVKKISGKAKVETSTKLLKPNFWVSTNVLELINKNRFLHAMELKIK